MENGDPEINSMDAEASGDSIHVSADIRAVRTCADCGTELKDYSHTIEDEYHISDFEGYSDLSEKDKQALCELLITEDESVSVEVEEEGGESEDGGGSRYQKNMITTTVHGTITVTWTRGEDDVVTLTKGIDLSDSAAASSYDECC